MTKRRNKATAVASLALCLAGVGFGGIEPLQALPKTAHRVYCYYTALQRNAQPMTWWDRVTYSLILAGSDGKAAKRTFSRT
jgi:hypothetical protein